LKPEELVEKITDEVKGEIKSLTTSKNTLKSQITIEFNVNQGGIGEVFMTSQRKAKVK
jgi:hypothetical protein